MKNDGAAKFIMSAPKSLSSNQDPDSRKQALEAAIKKQKENKPADAGIIKAEDAIKKKKADELLQIKQSTEALKRDNDAMELLVMEARIRQKNDEIAELKRKIKSMDSSQDPDRIKQAKEAAVKLKMLIKSLKNTQKADKVSKIEQATEARNKESEARKAAIRKENEEIAELKRLIGGNSSSSDSKDNIFCHFSSSCENEMSPDRPKESAKHQGQSFKNQKKMEISRTKGSVDSSNPSTANVTVIRSSPEPTNDVPHPYSFKTFTTIPDIPLMILGIDFKILSKTSKVLRMRVCPPEDYEDLNNSLQEEGLCPASPIIQIEDFESFLSDSCKEIHIRHNIYEWERYEKCTLRSYSDLQNPLNYINIEAEMFQEYIKVCGPTDEKEKDGRQEQGSSLQSTQPQQRSNRSGSNSNDEGYGKHDGSPKSTMRSLVLPARREDICNVRLYFSRDIPGRKCPTFHEISVYAVLDKKAKVEEFLEKELVECGMEQGAKRIRVAIDWDQIYTPILGESTKSNPQIIWEEEERSKLSSFSYSLLNQNNGFIELQKMPPPLTLFCDRRKYSMIKLTTNSNGKPPPENPIYDLGANIVPISCQLFRDIEHLATGPSKIIVDISSLNNAFHVPSVLIPPPTTSSDEPYSTITAANETIHIVECPLEDLPPGPSNPVDIRQKENGDSSTGETLKCPKEPPKKRRRQDEIEQGRKSFPCRYCSKILTRKQTLTDHIQKFHRQHAPDIPEVSSKGKGKGKKSSAHSNLPTDIESSSHNQQDGHLQGHPCQLTQQEVTSENPQRIAAGVQEIEGESMQRIELGQGNEGMQVDIRMIDMQGSVEFEERDIQAILRTTNFDADTFPDDMDLGIFGETEAD